MNDDRPISWCVTRHVALAPPVAAGTLTELVDARREPTLDDAARLDGGLVVAPSHGTGALRTFPGRLSVSRWRRPLTVELELGPWSRTAAELLLRPRRPPSLGLADAYWQASTAVLDTLRADLLAHAPERPARELRRAS
ncbi:MAG TPA: hypothetical protein VGU73_07085 [Acidimicrobiia bacterium]|nr:hypothetical protein [Acidimicrobiia bacterium]